MADRTEETAHRIKELRAYLQTSHGRRQQTNIESLISLYESGELQPPQKGDPDLFFVDGQRVTQDPIEDPSVPPGSMIWIEVYCPFSIIPLGPLKLI